MDRATGLPDAHWRDLLLMVKPQTVIARHRKGFKLFWKHKSRRRGGQPRKSKELAKLVRQMANDNVTRGAPRIHGELLKLGFDVSEATVSRYMPRRPRSPSQRWRIFLRNHAGDIAAVDFFSVATATFGVLYVFRIGSLPAPNHFLCSVGRKVENLANPPDEHLDGVMAALLRGRKRAEEIARQTGTCLVQMVDGKPARVPPKAVDAGPDRC